MSTGNKRDISDMTETRAREIEVSSIPLSGKPNEKLIPYTRLQRWKLCG